jgi:hypothetical protein
METVHRLLPEPLNPAGQKTVRFPATLLPLYDTLGIVEAFHLHWDLILQQLVDPVQMGLRFLVTEKSIVEFPQPDEELVFECIAFEQFTKKKR